MTEARRNAVLAQWRAGGATVGGWLSIGSPFAAEVMAHAGFDWLCLDLQHGPIDQGQATAMLQAIGTTPTVPLVRVPWNDPAAIMRWLDAGAGGVVVPLVNDREQAERAVAACRYPPEGSRSSGAYRAMLAWGTEYQRSANDEVACIVMIETAEALANLDAILSTPGVDAVYVGPADLAYGVGLEPGSDDPRLAEAIERVLDAARRHGVASGIHTNSAAQTAEYLRMGFQMVTLGSDRGFMRSRAESELAAAREAAGVAPLDVTASAPGAPLVGD